MPGWMVMVVSFFESAMAPWEEYIANRVTPSRVVNGPLCGRIVEQTLISFKSGDGTGVDDRAARFEMGNSRLGHEEVTIDICLECLVPLGFGEVLEVVLPLLKGCIIDEDVQPGELL